MRTRDQRLAVAVLTQVQKVPAAEHDQYGAMALKLPFLVRTAGLAQALAFLDARGTAAHKKLMDDVAEVVLGDGAKGAELLKRSREDQFQDYIRLSQSVMSALLWFKRYAQSVLDAKPGADASAEAAKKPAKQEVKNDHASVP